MVLSDLTAKLVRDYHENVFFAERASRGKKFCFAELLCKGLGPSLGDCGAGLRKLFGSWHNRSSSSSNRGPKRSSPCSGDPPENAFLLTLDSHPILDQLRDSSTSNQQLRSLQNQFKESRDHLFRELDRQPGIRLLQTPRGAAVGARGEEEPVYVRLGANGCHEAFVKTDRWVRNQFT